MKQKKTRTFIFIILVIAISLVLIIDLTKSGSSAQETKYRYKAIRLRIDRDGKEGLNLQKIWIADTYPQEYKLEIPTNYYNVLIFDGDNNILFSGKVVKEVMFFLSVVEGYPIQNETLIKTDEPLDLYLPYFLKAKSIQLKDDKGSLVLNIILSDYKLDPGKEISLCGNGICDEGEVFLTCFQDCRIQIGEFFKRIAP